MDEIKAKQQVVEKIKESAKILITVSDSPSVDALSAALALTMVFDKLEKYATSIFSGETPPAIAFLEPEKTFDDTTDSLRDFIIALNKEKADHLRYKVEGDSVKIFITPYKTTIDQNDLEFSQGDYNVELVIALGVNDQKHLDKALEDHGQILHDAAIITLTAGEQSSDLGGIDWHDASASSLSEMVAGLAEALKEDKKKSLVDAQIATALLTGIVAETDRFSNEHTTSRAMTVAGALMTAGADQQLIANELQAANEIDSPRSEPEQDSSDSDVEVDKTSGDGTMTIKNHDPSSFAISHDGETLADLDRRVLGDEKAKEKVTEEVELIQEEAAEEELAEEVQQPAAPQAPLEPLLPEPTVVPEPVFAPEPEPEPIPEPQEPVSIEPTYEETPRSPIGNAYAAEDVTAEPTFSGTLNATTEQAADDARREAESDQNKTILSHAYIGTAEQPTTVAASSSLLGTPDGLPGAPPAAPGSVGVNGYGAVEEVHSAYAPEDEPTLEPHNLGVGGERVIQPLPAPAPVAPAPAPFDLPLPPPIPDFSQVNGGAPAFPAPPPTQTAALLGDIFAQEPAGVDYTANAVAAPDSAYAPEPLPPSNPAPQNNPGDPGQFQIPPQ